MTRVAATAKELGGAVQGAGTRIGAYALVRGDAYCSIRTIRIAATTAESAETSRKLAALYAVLVAVAV